MLGSQAYTSRAYEGEQLRHFEILCPYHPDEVCGNYCVQRACLKMLCSQCIEGHVVHHKETGQSDLSIKSMKRVRQYCVDKLNKLMQDLFSRMSIMKQPKSPQEIIQDTRNKLQEIKTKMYQIIQDQFHRFGEQIKHRVNQSSNSIHRLTQIHDKLSKIITQLKDFKVTILQGNRQIPQTIQKVLNIDNTTYINIFGKQTIAYAQELSTINFQLNLNQNVFRKAVNQSLKINNQEKEQFHRFQSNIPETPKSYRPKNNKNTNISLPTSIQQSEHKILHFFQTGEPFLHLIDVYSGFKKSKINLPEFITPDFHATILSKSGHIFISGGLIEVGGSQVKMMFMCRYSLKTSSLKKEFAKVLPRSSHSLCEYGDYIYILGGYGVQNKKNQTQMERRVERISIKKGQVSEEEPSRWGGANISVVMNGRIIKASTEGVQAYNITTKEWKVLTLPEGYWLSHGCGWSKLSQQHLLIYGGYDGQAKGVSRCQLWLIKQNQILIKQEKDLPKSQGFSNNPGIVNGGKLFVLQNVPETSENEESYLVESERVILCFDGSKWTQWE